MAFYADLTDQQKTDLKRLLNNLNLGLAKLHFGDIYLAMLEGHTPVLTGLEIHTLRNLLNDLNLGTYHHKFGDYIVGLIDPTLDQVEWSATELADVERALNKLNIPLARLNMGEILDGMAAMGAKAVEKKADLTGYVGDDVAITALFTLKGGAAPADLTLTATPAASVDIASDNTKVTIKAAGDVTIKAQIGSEPEVTAKITAAVKPVITAKKNAAANFKVGDADLAAADLFDVTPAGTAITLAITPANPTVAAIVAGKVQGKGVGDAVVVASAPGAADVSVTVSVKAATEGVTVIKDEVEVQVGENVALSYLFKHTGSAVPVYTTDGSAFVTLAKDIATGVSAGTTEVTATLTTGSPKVAKVKLKVIATPAAPVAVGKGDILGKKPGDVLKVDEFLNFYNGIDAGYLNKNEHWGYTPPDSATFDDAKGELTIVGAATAGDITVVFDVGGIAPAGSTYPLATNIEAGRVVIRNVAAKKAP